MNRLLTAVALVAGLLSPAASASAILPSGAEHPPPGVGIRLVDVPVAAAEDPRAQVYIIDHVAPGTLIERRVEVSNGTDSAREISVYPAAVEIRDDAFTGAKGRTQNELSGWTSVDPETLELESGERAMVDVTIEVPPEASRGERYAVIWAEMVTPGEDGGVTHVSRVGVRIYLSVGPGGALPTDLKITSLTAARTDAGIPFVQAAVRNTGERAIDLVGKLRLDKGPGGLATESFTAKTGTTVAIGETAPLTVKLDKQLPRGPWRAHMTVSSGLTKRTAQATITFPKKAGAAPAVQAEITQSEGIPRWVIGAALGSLLLLLIVVAIILIARRRNNQEAEVSDPQPVDAP